MRALVAVQAYEILRRQWAWSAALRKCDLAGRGGTQRADAETFEERSACDGHGYWTDSVTFTEWVRPAPVPVIVKARVPL